MIANMKVEEKWRHVVMWVLSPYVNFNDDAYEENMRIGEYKYFTGMCYDVDTQGLLVDTMTDYDDLVDFKLEELERLGCISDVIIDGG